MSSNEELLSLIEKLNSIIVPMLDVCGGLVSQVESLYRRIDALERELAYLRYMTIE